MQSHDKNNVDIRCSRPRRSQSSRSSNWKHQGGAKSFPCTASLHLHTARIDIDVKALRSINQYRCLSFPARRRRRRFQTKLLNLTAPRWWRSTQHPVPSETVAAHSRRRGVSAVHLLSVSKPQQHHLSSRRVDLFHAQQWRVSVCLIYWSLCELR